MNQNNKICINDYELIDISNIKNIENSIYKLLFIEQLTDEQTVKLEYLEDKRDECMELERIQLSEKSNITYDESVRLNCLEKVKFDKDKYISLDNIRKIEFRIPYNVTKRRLDVLDYKYPCIKQFVYPLNGGCHPKYVFPTQLDNEDVQPPDVFESPLVNEYINSFDEKQKIAYKIAKECLKYLFDITKPNGFLNFLKQKQVYNYESTLNTYYIFKYSVYYIIM